MRKWVLKGRMRTESHSMYVRSTIFVLTICRTAFSICQERNRTGMRGERRSLYITSLLTEERDLFKYSMKIQLQISLLMSQIRILHEYYPFLSRSLSIIRGCLHRASELQFMILFVRLEPETKNLKFDSHEAGSVRPEQRTFEQITRSDCDDSSFPSSSLLVTTSYSWCHDSPRKDRQAKMRSIFILQELRRERKRGGRFLIPALFSCLRF